MTWEKYGQNSSDLIVLSVNFGNPTNSQIAAYNAANGVRFPTINNGAAIARSFGATGTPTVVFINPDRTYTEIHWVSIPLLAHKAGIADPANSLTLPDNLTKNYVNTAWKAVFSPASSASVTVDDKVTFDYTLATGKEDYAVLLNQDSYSGDGILKFTYLSKNDFYFWVYHGKTSFTVMVPASTIDRTIQIPTDSINFVQYIANASKTVIAQKVVFDWDLVDSFAVVPYAKGTGSIVITELDLYSKNVKIDKSTILADAIKNINLCVASNNLLVLDIQGADNYNFSLFGADGKMIPTSYKISNCGDRLSVFPNNTLAQGIYFLRAESDKATKTLSILVK